MIITNKTELIYVTPTGNLERQTFEEWSSGSHALHDDEFLFTVEADARNCAAKRKRTHALLQRAQEKLRAMTADQLAEFPAGMAGVAGENPPEDDS